MKIIDEVRVRDKVKTERKESFRLITAVVLMQLVGLISIILLKYEMDVFSTNYVDMEASSYEVLVELKELSTKVYEHESCVSRYIISDNKSDMADYQIKAQSLRADINQQLTSVSESMADLANFDDTEHYEDLETSITAYLNSADIAFELRRNNSYEVAQYLLNNNMRFYVDQANDSMEELNDIANENLTDAKTKLHTANFVARLTFVIGFFVFAMASIFGFRYCKKMLKIQEVYIQEANSANKAKSAFLSSVSHEIRTPINAVIGLNEMISRSSEDETILGYSEKIEHASTSLLSLVNDILDFSKIEAGKMELVDDNYEISSMVIDLWDMLYERANKKGLELIFDIDENIPSVMYGDSVRIKQIIVNLLTNAVKYTQEGKVTLSITFERTGNEAGRLSAHVIDTGMGINPSEIGKLTQAFERIDTKKNAKVEGTGLGLSIVNNLLKLMDSQLEVESTYGKGSDFGFTISQQIVDPAGVGRLDPKKNLKVKKKENKAAFYAPKAKILAVDDNEVNRLVISELLKRTGVQVDLGVGGLNAVELAKQKKYNVILMDHFMPEVDGIEAIGMIKKEGLNTDTPAVVVTANTAQELAESYFQAGFDAFLKKPIDAKELESVIMKYLPSELLEKVPGSSNESGAVETPDDSNQYKHINKALGIQTCGGPETYCTVVDRFVSVAKTDKEKIIEAWKNRDIQNYVILVHALKSTAKLVGAEELAERALHLELSGKEHDMNEIDERTDALFEEYDDVIRELRGVDSSDTDSMEELFDESTTINIEASTLQMLLKQVTRSAEADEYEDCDDTLSTLNRYKLSKNKREHFDEMQRAAKAKDKDKILSLVQQAKEAMKNE